MGYQPHRLNTTLQSDLPGHFHYMGGGRLAEKERIRMKYEDAQRRYSVNLGCFCLTASKSVPRAMVLIWLASVSDLFGMKRPRMLPFSPGWDASPS